MHILCHSTGGDGVAGDNRDDEEGRAGVGLRCVAADHRFLT
eukprot:COSAG05_NODE_17056_length_333_cov_0.427350_1_plen_40_part_10